MLAYVDASVWIARVEGEPYYKNIVEEKMDELTQKGWLFCISKAVMMEVFHKPYRNHNPELVSLYNEIFGNTKVLPGYSQMLEDGFNVMKIENLKAMDSIHVALALHYNCEGFVSTDTDFQNLRNYVNTI